jgi:hypothetical protein
MLLYALETTSVNWEALGAIAEFTASVGVLATLIYIAVQVREAKSMNLINNSSQMTNNVAGRIIDNPHLVDILAKVSEKTGYQIPQAEAAAREWGLTTQEAEVWARYWGTVWRGLQARHAAGELEDRTLEVFLRDPQSRFYVLSAEGSFTEDFKERVAAWDIDLVDANLANERR